jgi:hypothetical protein
MWQDDIRPGFLLEHRGSMLGVVERVQRRDADIPPVLRARGGRSGALEYLVARSDVVAVHPGDRAAEVRPDVDFGEATLELDGHVTLVARERRAGRRAPRVDVPPACVGFDCFAEDGRVGRVEEVLAGPHSTTAFLVLCVRRLLWRRYPVVPASLVIAVDLTGRHVLLRGPRAEIASASERLPLAS